MPADAPAPKIESTRRLGAEVRLYDRSSESREEIGAAISEEMDCLIRSMTSPELDGRLSDIGSFERALRAISPGGAGSISMRRRESL